MKTVNALTIRNRFGEVLSYLEDTNEPVLVTKGKRVRAALVPIEEFERRFLDKRAEEIDGRSSTVCAVPCARASVRLQATRSFVASGTESGELRS